MTIIGITGHQNLTYMTRRLVAAVITQRLADLNQPQLLGITSLAPGADQTFAFCVLAVGGQIKVVVPAHGYHNTMTGDDQRCYNYLLALATTVIELPFANSTEAAYFAAGRFIVERCDLLLAVWDGQPATGIGGTGDIVTHAQEQGVQFEVVWPNGATRM